MPPKRPPTPARRCVYREGRRQCQRAGKGNPPLCRPHTEIVAEDFDASLDAEDLIHELANRASDMVANLSETLSGIFQTPAAAQAAAQARIAYAHAQAARMWQAQRQGQAPPRARAAPPPPKKDDDLGEAYDVLGFPRGAKVTKEQVKTRQRALAKILHPDAGGSDEAMKKLNASVKTVLAVLS